MFYVHKKPTLIYYVMLYYERVNVMIGKSQVKNQRMLLKFI